MKNTSVSSSVPNMRAIPRLSTHEQSSTTTHTQTLPTPPVKQQTSITPSSSLPGLTGLESTEGNYAESYVPPNEAILAEYAFAEEVYKKNKRKYQRMLVAPAIQQFIAEGEINPEILLKP